MSKNESTLKIQCLPFCDKIRDRGSENEEKLDRLSCRNAGFTAARLVEMHTGFVEPSAQCIQSRS